MNNIKALLAKAWKDEELDLEAGRHYFDEVLTVRLTGTVEKQADQLVIRGYDPMGVAYVRAIPIAAANNPGRPDPAPGSDRRPGR